MKKDKRINLLELEKNCGAAESRNLAMKEAKGEYLAFLDSDDTWKEKKLTKQIEFMITKSIVFSFTAYRKEDEKGNFLSTIPAKQVVTYTNNLMYNRIGTSTVILKRTKFKELQMPLLKRRQDYATWLFILRNNTNAYGLNEVLTIYKVRKQSISSNKVKLIKYNWRIYREYEKLNYFQSFFYLFIDIASKIFKLK